MSQASKADLWKVCKAREIAFEKPYQKLTREELANALAAIEEPVVVQHVAKTRTPTEEELRIKALREEAKATRMAALELEAQKAAAKAQKMLEKAQTPDVPAVVVPHVAKIRTPTEEELRIKALREEAKVARIAAAELRASESALKAQKSLEAIQAQKALNEAAKARKAQLAEEQAAIAAKPIAETVIVTMNDELLTDAKDVETEGKRFRIQNQRFFLTYKTHLVKEDVASFFGEKNVKECICAHERADESSPYEHTHVYIDFGRNYQSTNARVFDFSGIHPNIKVIRSGKHLENIWAYLCKEDKTNEHLLGRITKKTLFDTVAACKSVQEVMRMATKPNDAMGLCALYALRDREQVEIKPLSQEWQLELATELEGKPHNRKIIWYYDAVGGTGKTEFSVYMQASKLATVMSQLGGDRDSGQLIETARDNGWDGKVIIIDIPRQGEHRSIYSPLEAIKNGLVTNVKYRGGTTTYPCPHLVVMANFLPRIHEMSLDRWDVRELLTEVVDDVRRVHARPMTLDEIHRRALEHTSVAELRDELLRRASGCATKRDMLLSLIDNARHELKVLDGLATP